MIVLDASVAVKLVTREPGSIAALQRVLEDEERIAPDWIRMEVGSALSRKVREGGLPIAEALAARSALLPYLTEQVDSLVLIDEGFALSVQLGHGLYDCLYLALALRRDVSVLTADQRFVERAAQAGYAATVELLT